MSVTNGFLRLNASEFENISNDEDAFEDLVERYDDSESYLDMDKAGYELAFILDDSLTPTSNAAKQEFQNIANVLAGGTVLHPDLDLGYGPAMVVDKEAIEKALEEFKNLSFEAFLGFTNDELLSEILPSDFTEDEFRRYHWEYLQTLMEFLRESVNNHSIVLRY
jgi:hypothetical protein